MKNLSTTIIFGFLVFIGILFVDKYKPKPILYEKYYEYDIIDGDTIPVNTILLVRTLK